MSLKIDAKIVSAIDLATCENYVNHRIFEHIRVINDGDEDCRNLRIYIKSNPCILDLVAIHQYDCVASGETLDISDINGKIIIDKEYLIKLEDSVSADIVLEIYDRNSNCIASSDILKLRVKPYNEWSGVGNKPEMISAFILPSPSLLELRRGVSKIMKSWGSNESLDGYESENPTLIREFFAASYIALSSQKIRSIVPPTNFALNGLKVRMADMVLNEKEGTCVDLTLIMCSLLESMGLNPIVVITENYMMPGVWLVDNTFRNNILDASEIINAVNSKRVALIDPLGMTIDKSKKYENAEAESLRRLSSSNDFIVAVDVKYSRNSIGPLPLYRTANGSWNAVSQPTVLDDSRPPRQFNYKELLPQSLASSRRSNWEKKILNTSPRNSLINLKLTQNKAPLMIGDSSEFLDTFTNGAEYTLYFQPEYLNSSQFEKKPFDLSTLLNKNAVQEDLKSRYIRLPYTALETKKRLGKIYAEAKKGLEETGSNTLFVAFDLLKWRDRKDIEYHAPLVLVPATLKKTYNQYFLTFKDEEISVNETLIEKLKRDENLDFGDLNQLSSDEFDLDLVRRTISSRISAMKGWSVVSMVVLGCFSFNEFVMWRDLKERWASIENNKTVKNLIDKKPWPTKDLKLAPNLDGVKLVEDADSSQILAIKTALKGETFVLHGPPGTGKSQTITNIIANLLLNGKTVLFVAEKSEALNVVKKRLDDIGIGDFCLEMHSNKTNKSKILNMMCDNLQYPFSDLQELTLENKLAKRQKELDDYSTGIYKETALGCNLHDVLSHYLETAENECISKPRLKIVNGNINSTHLDDVEFNIVNLCNYWNPLRGVDVHIFRKIHLINTDVSASETKDALIDVSESVEKINTYLSNRKISSIRKIGDIDSAIATAELIAVHYPTANDAGVFLEYGKKSITFLSNILLNVNTVGKLKFCSHRNIIDNVCAYQDSINQMIESNEEIARLIESGYDYKQLDEILQRIRDRLLKIADFREYVQITNKTNTDKNSNLEKDIFTAAIFGNFDLEPYISHLNALTSSTNLCFEKLTSISNYIDVRCVASLKQFEYDMSCIDDRVIRLKDRESVWEQLIAYSAAVTKMQVFMKNLHYSACGASSYIIPNPEFTEYYNELLQAYGKTGSFSNSSIVELTKINDNIQLLKKIDLWHRQQSLCIEQFESVWNYDVLYKSKKILADWDYVEKLPFLKKKKGKQEFLIKYKGYLKMDIPLKELSEPIMFLNNMYDELKVLMEFFDKYCYDVSSEITYIDELAESIYRHQTISPKYDPHDLCSLYDIYVDSKGTIEELLDYGDQYQKLIVELTSEIKSNVSAREITLDVYDLEKLVEAIAEYAETGRSILTLFNEPEYANLIDTVTKIPKEIDSLKELSEKTTAYVSSNRDVFEHLLSNPYELKELKSAHEEFMVSLDHLKKYVTLSIDNESLQEWTNVTRDILKMERHLTGWINYNATSSSLNGNYDTILQAVENGEPATKIINTYRIEVYKKVINDNISDNDALKRFNLESINTSLIEFRKYDSELIKENRKTVLKHLKDRIFRSDVHRSSEKAYLVSMASKKWTKKSLRNIFSKIRGLLPFVAPCMMMSPISVAQYLDPDMGKFDYVIFDEASQIPTHVAIGAIARGQEAIIVGDLNQLPPTTFFKDGYGVNEDEDEDEDENITDLESILEECHMLSIPSNHLLWHYRSKHESLIAFSNHQYYNDKLMTFPSPDDMSRKVKFVKVNGSYDLGRTRQNVEEAKAVVKEIVRRLKGPESKYSIGVVTFGAPQRDKIQELLDEALGSNPQLCNRSDDILVKNLENIQGDERDVIIFSIGYGRDSNGKMLNLFGPINKIGGWRRLNVAITRAKYEMIVFSTINYTDIEVNSKTSMGVAELRDFIKYAETGELNIGAKNSDTSYLFAQLISNKIMSRGYKTKTNVGKSGFKIDVGVVDPDDENEYVLGILTDGPTYRKSKNSRDREFAQIKMLESMGWNIERVWIMDWHNDERRVIERLIGCIEKAADEKRDLRKTVSEKQCSSATCNSTAISPDPEKNVRVEKPTTNIPIKHLAVGAHIDSPEVNVAVLEKKQVYISNKKPYIPARVNRRVIHENRLNNSSFNDEYISTLMEIVHIEYPICESLLIRSLLSTYGVPVNDKNINRCKALIDSTSFVVTKGLSGNSFYWPRGYVVGNYTTYRDTTDCLASRSIDAIAPEEIANALNDAIESGLEGEDAALKVAEWLGCTTFSETHAILKVCKDINLNEKKLDRLTTSEIFNDSAESKIVPQKPISNDATDSLKISINKGPKYNTEIVGVMRPYATYNCGVDQKFNTSDKIEKYIVETVKKECPIAESLIIKRVCGMLGRDYTDPNNSGVIRDIIRRCANLRHYDDCGKRVYGPIDFDIEKYPFYRPRAKEERLPEEIPSVEYINAATYILKNNKEACNPKILVETIKNYMCIDGPDTEHVIKEALKGDIAKARKIEFSG